MRLSAFVVEPSRQQAARSTQHEPPAPWPRFVVAALIITVLVGALSGAFDLWRLRFALHGVPVDHHRAHGIAQLFGFLWLFTTGLSLHLGPRFFGAELPTPGRAQFLRWCGISGVALTIYGRFGGLLPGTMVAGLVGTVLLVTALSAWLELVLSWRLTRAAMPDVLHDFVLSGTLWWWLGGATLLVWQIGQAMGGPFLRLPLEAVWVPALWGGGASWVWGVFLRAGLCTLQRPTPSEQWQRAWFWSWQLAVMIALADAWLSVPVLSVLSQLVFAVAVALMWFALRPDQSEAKTPQARAVRSGLWFIGTFGVLKAWQVLTVVGVWAPDLISDATRHAFSLGGMTLMVFGFAGRMVPGFARQPLAFAAAYSRGVKMIELAALLRLAELLPIRAGMVLSAASGGLALVGVGLVSTALLRTMWLARRERFGVKLQTRGMHAVALPPLGPSARES